ncbi:hypothetical protein ACFPMF_06605 [Larkinella bovis]|uniref:Uncharacterized protein n=1 Tax=Larkinella bovis TaxID=683041 RepID=A0ABW0I6L5_9BACT
MLPIVFIHTGYQSYLEYSLRQGKLANPESAVFLLGDDANQNRFPFAQHRKISALNPARADEFTRIYVHRSTNPYWYELLCFIRWFHVLAFMEERQLDEVFVADSDVMIYKNVGHYTPWSQRSAGQQAAYCLVGHQTPNSYSWLASGHSSYWTRQGLSDFCDYLLSTYRTTTDQARLEEKWQYHGKNRLAGGVSDMALLYLYALDHPGRVINLLPPLASSGQRLKEVFDLNISIPHNYAENEYDQDIHGLKKVQSEALQYVGYNRILKETCIFNTLHFQGLSKRYIHQFYQGTDLRLHQFGQELSHRLAPVLAPVRRLKSGLQRILNK